MRNLELNDVLTFIHFRPTIVTSMCGSPLHYMVFLLTEKVQVSYGLAVHISRKPPKSQCMLCWYLAKGSELPLKAMGLQKR